MKPITRIELDIMAAGGCSAPGCKLQHERLEELFICQQCHPKEALQVRYVPAEGNLYVECVECEAPVLVVEVK